MTTTKENLANPGPVGLCGFALTTWLLSLSSRKAIRLALPLLSAMAPSGGHGLCLPSFSKVKQPRHLSVGISAYGVCFR